MKNGPRVWAFCKIEFPGIQKPVQFFGQKSRFFRNPGNRGVGVIWLVRGLGWMFCYCLLVGRCLGVIRIGCVCRLGVLLLLRGLGVVIRALAFAWL